MPAIARAAATLRFQAPDLDPDEITLALGIQPDAQQRRHDEIPTSDQLETRVAKFGMWRLGAVTAEPGDLNQQVADLLARLTQDISTWRRLTSKYKADLFCGWFMTESNEGEDISPGTLMALGERGIALAMDIYAPETDAPPSAGADSHRSGPRGPA